MRATPDPLRKQIHTCQVLMRPGLTTVTPVHTIVSMALPLIGSVRDQAWHPAVSEDLVLESPAKHEASGVIHKC